MFEKIEEPSEVFSEIKAGGEGWRAEHLDLPVTLLFLSRIKRALAGMKRQPEARGAWDELKAKGESFSRRRALFIAAEAVGHLPPDRQVGERETIRNELGVVLDEGTSLHKVRALRALSFIASDECIPILEKGLQDRSPWVQATTLRILFHTNLRQGAPRKVLTDFLHDNFRRQTTREAALDPEKVVKHFLLNKGLFTGLLKVPGGKRLALLSLRLWVTASILTALVALRAAARQVFVVLPGKILSTPDLGRKTWKAFHTVFIRLPYKILTTPLWVRELKLSPGTLRTRYFYLALLDYAFLYLLFVASPPQRTRDQQVFVFLVFALLFVCSAAFTKIREAEQFRWFNRCGSTALLAWFAYDFGESERTTLTLIALAASQGVWVLPQILKIVFMFVVGAVVVVVGGLWAIVKTVMLELASEGEGKVENLKAEDPKAESPPRKLSFGDVTLVIAGLLRVAGRFLRPRLRQIASAAAVVVFFLLTAYLTLRSLQAAFPDASLKLAEPEVAALLLALKPYLYFLGGGLIMMIPCYLVLAVFHVLWDELLIVERVRFRIRSRNPERFKSINEFLSYVFQIVRDQTLSTGLRVRAAFALTQVPLASQAYVDRLTDLAEEGLPINVSDAIYEVVEDADKRLKRGQMDTFEIDMGLINRQLEDIWKPGEVLRPWILKGLGFLVLAALLAGAAAGLFSLDDNRPTDTASLICLTAGCYFISLYAFISRKEGVNGKWLLLAGLILLVSVIARPLQVSLYSASWDSYFVNGVVGLVELSTLSVFVVPAILAGAVARMGHTLYLLGGDVEVNLDLEGKPNLFERKHKRLKSQAFIVRPLLLVALCAIVAQSRPLQEYLDRRQEKMPSFAPTGNGSEVVLKDIPTDGRVVRVAMVRVDRPKEETTDGDEILPPDQRVPAVEIFLREAGLYPLNHRAVWGDVWLFFEDGEPRAWATSPVGCLVPAAATEEDAVAFNLHLRCSYEVKVRLVAVVYDERRSAFIKGMRTREEEWVTPEQVRHPDDWLLIDTASPFVKAAWSPPF